MIKVNVTSGNVYEVADGAGTELNGISPVGELAVSVYTSAFKKDEEHWIATFGNVEAVYIDGEVVMTTQPQAPSAGAQATGPWA